MVVLVSFYKDNLLQPNFLDFLVKYLYFNQVRLEMKAPSQ